MDRYLPSVIRFAGKRVYYRLVRLYNRWVHIEKGRFVELGYRFRLDRRPPYRVLVGAGTIAEDFNVWNAEMGDIVVGERCWFGLQNIVMGPVEIGEGVSTGPRAAILGPRHPVRNAEKASAGKTVIGRNVWIGTGAIILFGVKIGDNAVVSAGSVVGKDVAEGAFVGGNPARDLTKLVSPAWEGSL